MFPTGNYQVKIIYNLLKLLHYGSGSSTLPYIVRMFPTGNCKIITRYGSSSSTRSNNFCM